MTRKLVVDVETTTTKLTDKYTDYSPYNPNNKLVSIGWGKIVDNKLVDMEYVFLYHSELMGFNGVKLNKFKADLAEADVVIAHNSKFDLQWLVEAGFDINHLKIEDTMIREYVLARGRTDFSLRLADTCIRYGVAEKGELFEKYPDMQISEMPIEEVEEYGRADIQACAELYVAQEERLAQDSYANLHKTVDMMNEFCKVLADIERNGVKIDVEELDSVGRQFTGECEYISSELNRYITDVMGDTRVNLESPQQLSEVIYSRRVKPGCEEEWVRTFNIGRDSRGKNLKRPKMGYNEYKSHVKRMTVPVMKTVMEKCTECDGKGRIKKMRKDGKPFLKQPKCKPCIGSGAVYREINEVAGFKMKPANVYFTTISGFSTSSGFLKDLVEQAHERKDTKAEDFLSKLTRLSSVSSHLSNFVGGIGAFVQRTNNILHPNFNQCITATGRLSSTKPNLQNQPREKTFPIRKVFTSRWDGGELIETDFSQLEFRAAVHLAADRRGREQIIQGFDIHSQTRDIITNNGQPIDRQEAKAHTFKPLYGGRTGTEAEQAYYRGFLKDLYKDIGSWHEKLQEEAINTKMVTLPTGRQYLFPDVQRGWHGGATRSTQIVNYPVQGFATGDIVPIAIIRLYKEMKAAKLKSVLVLTVHDSIVADVYPGEQGIMRELMSRVAKYAEEELITRYGIEMFVPLDCETKIGYNLMDMKKVA